MLRSQHLDFALASSLTDNKLTWHTCLGFTWFYQTMQAKSVPLSSSRMRAKSRSAPTSCQRTAKIKEVTLQYIVSTAWASHFCTQSLCLKPNKKGDCVAKQQLFTAISCCHRQGLDLGLLFLFQGLQWLKFTQHSLWPPEARTPSTKGRTTSTPWNEEAPSTVSKMSHIFTHLIYILYIIFAEETLLGNNLGKRITTAMTFFWFETKFAVL